MLAHMRLVCYYVMTLASCYVYSTRLEKHWRVLGGILDRYHKREIGLRPTRQSALKPATTSPPHQVPSPIARGPPPVARPPSRGEHFAPVHHRRLRRRLQVQRLAAGDRLLRPHRRHDHRSRHDRALHRGVGTVPKPGARRRAAKRRRAIERRAAARPRRRRRVRIPLSSSSASARKSCTGKRVHGRRPLLTAACRYGAARWRRARRRRRRRCCVSWIGWTERRSDCCGAT